MSQEIGVEAEKLDKDEELEKETKREKRRLANTAFCVCRKLVEAFEGCGPEMSDMDAADFKDRAGETWVAVQAAREVI